MKYGVRTPLWIAAWSVLVFVGLAWERMAYADIVQFTEPQSFFQSANIVSTETFEEFTSRTIIGVGSVEIDGITYTSDNPIAEWYTSDSFITPSAPNSLVQRNVIAPANLAFAGRTDAVGFFLVPGATFPPSNYRFAVTTAPGETFTFNSGIVQGTFFRGFTPLGVGVGISSVSITPLETPGGISNFNLDNVSRGVITIPEPSSCAMIFSGLGCNLAA